MYKPKVKAPDPQLLKNVQDILTKNKLTTVCEAAACPNRAECYQRNATTFMILGNTCTRACAFCNVKTGRGSVVDASEPARLAKAIEMLRLEYVVITSVDRDDLKDYGAKHFADCVYAIKKRTPDVKIELLTPDFKGDIKALDTIIGAAPHKLAHNQECVERLSPMIRPQSSYRRSLDVLEYYAKNANAVIKSSLMVGLGEHENELRKTMQELYDAGVRELTIGQYLQPTPQHHTVVRYYPPGFFDALKTEAFAIGFDAVASGILVRSSYFADTL
jgi:lipoic acid synthetase